MDLLSRHFVLAAAILVSQLSNQHWSHVTCYTLNNDDHRHVHGSTSRRDWLKSSILLSSISTSGILMAPPLPSHAKPAQTTSSSTSKTDPLERLLEAQETLSTLLTNYKRATIDCTFADVPRELLEAKNKELLLEKASTSVLFDKSVSVESCKTTNRIVRDYLGVTGKGPLVGIEKQIKAGLEFVDPDDLDDYVSELEKFSQSYSKAASLSYTSGVADFDSINNFSKDDAEGQTRNGNSNLSQARHAIAEAKGSLDRMVSILQKAA